MPQRPLRRLALHLTTATTASHLGLPPETIDAWERGEQPIDDDTVARIRGSSAIPAAANGQFSVLSFPRFRHSKRSDAPTL
jgi:transcriptional regulator with XRE-family HTH domain